MSARSLRSEFAANVLLSAAPSAPTSDSVRMNSDGSIEFNSPGVDVSCYRDEFSFHSVNDITSFPRR